MIDLFKLGIILSDTSRSRAYLQTLINKKIVPKIIVIMVNSNQSLIGKPKRMIQTPFIELKYNNDQWYFNPNESIDTTLNKSNLEFVKLKVDNIIDPKVISFLTNLEIDNLIYSGAGGIILKKELFSLGINFIHSHGGFLPKYQGSTCKYFSIIEENIISASVILMNEKIDSSIKFERYQLLNHIYGKIYNYSKNIKPAPDPHYILDKFYGTLSIKEYRDLFKTDQLLIVVDKPLTHVFPELYEDNSDFILNQRTIPSNSTFKLKRKSANVKKTSVHDSLTTNPV